MDGSANVAGEFAEQHYRELVADHRRNVFKATAATAGVLLVSVCVYAVLFPAWLDFAIGLMVGAIMTSALWAWDSPPEWMDKWRRGAEGERKTAEALAPLEASGWSFVHDVGRR